MNTEELPVGKGGTPLEYPHFPTRWQAFVWRNWELVSPAKIAAILHCSEPEARNAAALSVVK